MLAIVFVQMVATAQRRVAPTGRATDTNDVAVRLREAAELLQAGRIDDAEPIVRRVLAIAPQAADAHNLLGAILDQRGRTEEAEREYREALHLNLGARKPWRSLGAHESYGSGYSTI